ncbi:DUF262 domain-containing protein [Actinomycetospora sp. NBRC 106378]|uniref:GmrSD restriction endonuclease domain-containing protein n=1 Tax=Actinomycetospora sp. NBRC 106378 TaxID=3032208 RepID=UPI0024A09E1A|nr:DUF262 domain-containing protein [Actinomycetospora sp. NBRC 106378]GLZ51352.1 hypothetical protein Acsp07_09690 [Actinomycetospora sp. NBRC 106378]
MTKLSTVLDQVDAGVMLLPEFQRGYVWNRDQVRGLMKSVYREFPVGALLVWETEVSADQTRGGGVLAQVGGQRHLLLDGQQRVTTLYGVIRGRAPGFFDGDASAFTGLHFNVETEDFAFYAPMKMKNDARWLDVTKLFLEGTAPSIGRLMAVTTDPQQLSDYMGRVARLHNVLNRDFHIEQITGPDKTIDVVVDIFNRVNSGGTKLSKGDLALARICSEWDQARPWMRHYLDEWAKRDYIFNLDWLLRSVTAVAVGRSQFSNLEDVSAEQFEQALKGTREHIEHLLGVAVERLGIDHDRVLFGRYAFPVLARILSQRENGRFHDGIEANKAMAWYVQAAIRSRFTGSVETNLNKDLQIADREGVDGLLESLRKLHKGSLAVRAEDFEGVGRGARSYPLLYLLTRSVSGLDLLVGAPFAGRTTSLHVQEIFPRAELRAAGYSTGEINAIANFAFVTQDSARRLGTRLPEDHLPECSPDGLRAQWIPEDRALWRVDRYREFLAARRSLLAEEADRFLGELAAGTAAWPSPPLYAMGLVDEDENSPRSAQIKALLDDFADRGFAVPAVDCEIPDPGTGRTLAVAEAFWSEGLQAGLGNPVVLELDPEEADLARLSELGYEVFTSVDALLAHVRRRGELAGGDRTDEGTAHGNAGAEPAVETEPDRTLEPESETSLEDEFGGAIQALLDRCMRELRYNPRYFRLTISQHGALGATQRLLTSPGPSDGFVKLWENQRLDLTPETLVLDPRFADLFTDSERKVARARLDDFGYSGAA